jgi:hypothetical protein
MNVILSDADLSYARGIVAERRKAMAIGYRYDSYAANSPNFSLDQFEQALLQSIALESYIRGCFSISQREVEDMQPDLPNGVEVALCSQKNLYGRPYLVERKDGYHPTTTGFAVSEREIDLRYLITLDMVPRIHIVHSYPKKSGVTRHLVSTEDAIVCGADADVMERLSELVKKK